MEVSVKDFIYFINNKRGLTKQQVRRRDALWAKSFTEKDIEINVAEAKTVSATRLHCPLELVNFLNNFTKKDSDLKYTTHQWDAEDYDDFDVFVEKYSKQLYSDEFWKKNVGTRKILHCCPKLYYLIYNFLLKEQPNDSEYWGDRYKAGYKAGGILKKWMSENQGKQPYEMPLSEFPEGYIPADDDNRLVNFEDLVNVFKGLIEFRGNNFFHAVRRAFIGSDASINIDKNKLKTLQGKSLFTFTAGVENALAKISSNIKARSEYPDVDVWAEEVKDDSEHNVLLLHILHKGSFSDANIKSEKLMLRGKGGMIDIKKDLVSLCDFSVVSRFDTEKGLQYCRIDYLFEEDTTSEPHVVILDAPTEGFEYLLKFYL